MIIATAGHVDHGKTSLVKALTGTDTDRLPEEKKRGLTIDLGFAYLQTDAGHRAAFIDVPGHRKFIRNMIAGVGLVDTALLVVAADDGLMPQTVEHIAILKLMNVSQVLPVISKADLVEADKLDQVRDSVQQRLNSAGLTTTESHTVSIKDTAALQRLRARVIELVDSSVPRSGSGYFRMAIDRCFTLDGTGTVVTGTVISGMIEANESVSLVSNNASDGQTARVRGLHAQSTSATSARAGQRCALNLSGDLPRGDLQRGDWLVTNPRPVRSSYVDIALTVATDMDEWNHTQAGTLKHWTSAHLHIGTASVPCRIALLDCDEIAAGGSALARLLCTREIMAVHGDRFVLRDQSARFTIAGGQVLDAMPPRRGRSKPERLKLLHALNVAGPQQALTTLLQQKHYGLNLTDFSRQFNLLPDEVSTLTDTNGLYVVTSGAASWCLTADQSLQIEDQLLKVLRRFHTEHPDQLGCPAATVERYLDGAIAPDVTEHHLQKLMERGSVVRSASVFRHSDHQAAMNTRDDALWTRLEQALKTSALTPLRVNELCEVLDQELTQTERLLNVCVAHGKLYKVTDNRFFLPETLVSLAQTAQELASADSLTVAEFRNHTGVGRNLVVELLEYFDRCRFTQRIGNKRRVLKPVEEVF